MSPSEILLFGGRNYPHPQRRPPWDRFDQAVLLKVRDGRVTDRLEYAGCAIDRDVGLSVCFKAATIDGDVAYACTNTEVLRIDLRSFRIVGAHSHRFFNDLHHVTRIGDRFFVAGTGAGSVLEFDDSFELIHRHPVGDDDVIARFGDGADYRRIHDTKPRRTHVNFVAAWDGDVWFTELESRHVEGLNSRRRYAVSAQGIHDGVPALGRIWFTGVNGEVIKLDPRSGQAESFDLAPMTPTDRLLGWCRAIAPLGDTDVLVGFSKLRETRWRERLKSIGNTVLKRQLAIHEPTRVARYDLARGIETWRLELAGHGMDVVFSIHPR